MAHDASDVPPPTAGAAPPPPTDDDALRARGARAARAGTWRWNVATGDLTWTDEVFEIFGLDPATTPPRYEEYIARIPAEERDGVVASIEAALATGDTYSVEHRVVRPDRSERTIIAHGGATYGRDGTPETLTGIVIDITERAEAERELRESERMLAEAQSIAHIGVWDWDLRTETYHWSAEAKRIWGLPPDAVVHAPDVFAERMHPDDVEAAQEGIRHAIAAGEPFDVQHRIVLPDGRVRTVLAQGVATYDADGTPVRMTGTCLDLTERVAAAEALRESERSLLQAQELAGLGAFVVDPDSGSVDVVGDGVRRVLGLGAGPVDADRLLAVVHDEDRDLVVATFTAAIEGHTAMDLIHRIVREADGHLRWVRSCVTRDGDRVLGTVLDLTDQIEAQRRLELAQEIAHLGAWDVELPETRLAWTAEMARIHGLDPSVEPTPELWATLVHPEDKERVDAAVRGAIESGRSFAVEHRIVRPDGDIRIIRAQGRATYTSGGTPVRLTGTALDITERELGARALRESEHRLSQAQRIAGMGAWEWDVEAGTVTASSEFWRIAGYEPTGGFQSAEALFRLIHADDRARVEKLMRSALTTRQPIETTYRVVRADGRERVVSTQAEVMDDLDGRARVLGVSLDVSERVAAESALRQSEARFRRLADSAPVGIFETDPDGACVWTNARWTEITDVAADDALGHGWVATIHPDDRDVVLSAWRRAMLDGAPVDYEHRIVRGDGRIAYVAGRAVVTTDDTGRVTGSLGTITDVTERVQREREQQALRRVATAVAGDATPRALFGLVASEVAEVLEVQTCGIIQFDAAAGDAVVVGSSDPLSAAGPGIRLPLGQDLLGRVHRSGQAVRTHDAAEAVPFVARVRDSAPPAVACAVAAPVWMGRRLWGLIVVGRKGAELGPDTEERLESFGELVSLALAGADARRQLALQASTDHLTGLPNRRSFEDRLAAEVKRAQRHDRPLGLIVLDIDAFKEVNDLYGHEAGDRVLAEFALRLSSHARAGEIVARIGGEEFAWILPEADSLGALAAAQRVLEAIAAEPFPGIGQVTASGGVCDLEQADSAADLFRHADVALYWAKSQGRNIAFRYSPDVVELLSAEEQRSRLQRAHALGGIRVLAHAIDAKDPATQRHSERVAALAEALATRAGWSSDRVAALREAALVHDVGKIGVRDVVLLKPGRLDPEEYEEVKAHALLGARMVEGILSPDQVAWVLHHHERWDGTGYPHRIAGDEIPEGARILALADAFDAMVTARPYAAGLDPDAAVAEARRCAGAQFDPTVVTVLEAVHAAGLLTRPEDEPPIAPGLRPTTGR